MVIIEYCNARAQCGIRQTSISVQNSRRTNDPDVLQRSQGRNPLCGRSIEGKAVQTIL